MIELMQKIIPYISGLYTLPWILVGFVITALLGIFIDQQRLDRAMKTLA